MNSYDVYLSNDDLVFSENTMIDVHWSPLSIFPMELPNTYNVDIDLLEMNMATGIWSKLVSLASDVPNDGFRSVLMPSVEETETFDESISPVVVRVSISNRTIGQAHRKTNTGSLFARLGRFGLKIIRNAPVRFARKLARQAAQRLLCEAWGALEPPNRGRDILSRLPPCPRVIRDIQTPNSGFTEERLSSLLPVIGDVQQGIGNLNLPVIGSRVGDHIGYSIIDDKFREFFHPGTTNCFRQRVTTP